MHSQMKSEVGQVVVRVLMARAQIRKATSSYLSGWKAAPQLPSLGDLSIAYEQATDLIRSGEPYFLCEIAGKMDGYRGTLVFCDKRKHYCGLVFSKPYGSFFLVFGLGKLRSVRLFYMGIESEIAQHCSSIAAEFDLKFENAYFDLRDEVVGKFGIPR